jgi:hypothetical protein
VLLTTQVMEGIDLAMGLQQALFRLAVSLLDKREIKVQINKDMCSSPNNSPL